MWFVYGVIVFVELSTLFFGGGDQPNDNRMMVYQLQILRQVLDLGVFIFPFLLFC